ncbi:MAG: hypothetical protein ACREA0_34215 [bacterium]
MVSENEPVEPASTNPTSAPKNRGAAGFMMIGASIIVAGPVFFSLLLGEFSFSAIYVALAVMVLMSIFSLLGLELSNRALKLIGYFLGLVSLLLLLGDFRFGFPDGVIDNIANLTFYVGGFVMFAGARALPD